MNAFTIAFLASLPSLVLVHFVPKQPIEAETETPTATAR